MTAPHVAAAAEMIAVALYGDWKPAYLQGIAGSMAQALDDADLLNRLKGDEVRAMADVIDAAVALVLPTPAGTTDQQLMVGLINAVHRFQIARCKP